VLLANHSVLQWPAGSPFGNFFPETQYHMIISYFVLQHGAVDAVHGSGY
jgi:hypothetical protein